MKGSPSFSPKPPDHSIGRGQSERNKKHETGESDCDEWALGNVLQHVTPLKELIEPYVGGEMEGGIEKREESHHASELSDDCPAGDSPDGSDRQRYHDKPESPDSGRIGDITYRIGTDVARGEVPRQNKKRKECEKEDCGFEDPPSGLGRYQEFLQKFTRRSIPEYIGPTRSA